jgi:hypothetical protein
MKPEGSSPCSQEPAPYSYSEPNQLCPRHLDLICLKTILILSFHLPTDILIHTSILVCMCVYIYIYIYGKINDSEIQLLFKVFSRPILCFVSFEICQLFVHTQFTLHYPCVDYPCTNVRCQ